MKIIQTINELKGLIGSEIGKSPLIKITQSLIDKFADATFDHQWIHTQPDLAATASPFKATIAHGYFTLSLAPYLVSQVYKLTSTKTIINYGTEKVRFMAPVVVDSELFIRVRLHDLRSIDDGYRLVSHCTYFVVGKEKPVCYAELISLIYEH